MHLALIIVFLAPLLRWADRSLADRNPQHWSGKSPLGRHCVHQVMWNEGWRSFPSCSSHSKGTTKPGLWSRMASDVMGSNHIVLPRKWFNQVWDPFGNSVLGGWCVRTSRDNEEPLRSSDCLGLLQIPLQSPNRTTETIFSDGGSSLERG